MKTPSYIRKQFGPHARVDARKHGDRYHAIVWVWDMRAPSGDVFPRMAAKGVAKTPARALRSAETFEPKLPDTDWTWR